MSTELTEESPWVSRFWGWAEERFPPANCILFFILFATSVLFARVISSSGTIQIDLGLDILRFVGFLGFFFLLRVFDEHKDYELDCVNHPQRVLQRGLITLTHLKILGGIAVLIQAVVTLVIDGGVGLVTQTWLLTIIWASLMAKEFFIGEWLEKRLFLYAFSHMIVMPMAIVWGMHLGTDGIALPQSILVLAFFSFFSGFTGEIARKLKTPAQEIDTIDSYTKAFGTRNAPLVVMGLMLIQVAFFYQTLALIFADGVGIVWMAIVVVVFLGGCVPFIKFWKDPTQEELPKKMEDSAGGVMGVFYLMIITAIVLERGLAFA